MTHAIVLAALLALAPEEAALAVAGDLPAAGTLKLSDLKSLGPVPVEWSARGQQRRATGVPLDRILARAGFSPGAMGKDVPPKEKRSGWKKAVVATASDGFQAVFSCAELFPDMGPTRAFVVWEVEGKPVGPDEGPLRLVVTTDKEPARSVRQLVKLEVVDLRSR